MKTSFLLSFTILIILSTQAFAQNYHLIYETDIPDIKLSQDSIKTNNTKFEWVKGKYHILTYSNKKAISFEEDTYVSSVGYRMHNSDSYNNYTVIDRKKSRHISVMAYYNEKVNKVFINNFENISWQNTDPLSPPEISGLMQYCFDRIEKENDTIIEWKAPEIDFYDDTKQINGYTCKKAYLHSPKRPLTIWYTEEIDFSWCFSDYRNLIPGTVVLIEFEGKPTFELLSVKDLYPDNLPVRKEILKKLRKLK